MFNLGKAEETYFQSKMNVYPSDKERIERNLTNETYNLDNPNNNDATKPLLAPTSINVDISGYAR